MSRDVSIVPVGRIEQRIFLIRGQKVMLDADLAELYGVETRVLNQAVKRNPGRFPKDFLFQLTAAEAVVLRSQAVMSKPGRGGRRHRPYAFTEHGALMAASVLNSQRAVKASIYVVRAFVKLREMLATHRVLASRLAELERKLDTHDRQILTLIDAIRELMAPPEPKRKPIGFSHSP